MSFSPPDYQRIRPHGPLPQLNSQGRLVQTYRHVKWQGLGKGYTIQLIEYPVGSFPAFTTMAYATEDEDELPFTTPPPRRRGPLIKSHRPKTRMELEEEEYREVLKRHSPHHREKLKQMNNGGSGCASSTFTNAQPDATNANGHVPDAQMSESAATTTTKRTTKSKNDLKAFALLVLPFLQNMIWPPLVTLVLTFLTFYLLNAHKPLLLYHVSDVQLPTTAETYQFFHALSPFIRCFVVSFVAIAGVIVGVLLLVIRALFLYYTGLTMDHFWMAVDTFSGWLTGLVSLTRPLTPWIFDNFPWIAARLGGLVADFLEFSRECAVFVIENKGPFSESVVRISTSVFSVLARVLRSIYGSLAVIIGSTSNFCQALPDGLRQFASSCSRISSWRIVPEFSSLYHITTYSVRATLRFVTRPGFWAGCVVSLMFLNVWTDHKVAGALIGSVVLLLFTHNWTAHTHVYPHEVRPASPTARYYFETPSPRQMAARSGPRKIFT